MDEDLLNNSIPKENDLDKSFCREKEVQSEDEVKKLIEIESDYFKFKNDDMIFVSEDDDFSGCLLPSLNPNQRKFAELNLSNPSSNELNIFDSLDLKYKNRPSFFRQLTKTHCEVSSEEEKIIQDRILNFYIKTTKDNSNNLFTYIDATEEVYSNIILSNIHNGTKKELNNLKSFTNLLNINDKLIESDFNASCFNRLLNSQKSNTNVNIKDDTNDIEKLFEENKQKFANLNPINFNILVIGQKSAGKSYFVRKFLNLLKYSNNKTVIDSICSPSPRNPLKDINDSMSRQSDLNDSKIKPTSTFKSYKIKRVQANNSHNNLYDFTITDSPGYTEKDKGRWKNDIFKYIDDKYKEYTRIKNNENTFNNNFHISDCRIHLCLYFTLNIPDKFDYETMRDLSSICNLIPVVWKSESISVEQAIEMKIKIVQENETMGIKLLELDATLNRICSDPNIINNLIGGQLGFCPPFILSSNSGALSDSYLLREKDNWINACQQENSDFYRLYIIVTCFIPFECIERTKKFYKIIKKQYDNYKQKEIINGNYLKILISAGALAATSCLALGYRYFKNFKNQPTKK